MEFIHKVIDFFLHLDTHLAQWATENTLKFYLILFAIIFCETGLVVTPFLPGDSLLFAVGALASRPEFHLSLPFLIVLLSIAAILGDAVNYTIGYRVGPKVFSKEESPLLNKKHLLRAQRFYEKYGGKTIFLARFVPIIRTFAPFVAGIGKMGYTRFAVFNIAGGVVWVSSFLIGGYLFGDLPVVKRNFHLVIFGIIIVSLVPVAVEFWRGRREAKAEAARGALAPDKAREIR